MFQQFKINHYKTTNIIREWERLPTVYGGVKVFCNIHFVYISKSWRHGEVCKNML